jgi:hypothetical protein
MCGMWQYIVGALMLRWNKKYFVTQEYSILEFPAVEDEVVRQ